MKRTKRERGKKGWRKPKDTIIVDRTSKWGNPYRVSKQPGYSVRFKDLKDKSDYPGQMISRFHTSKADAAKVAISYYQKYIDALIDVGKLNLDDLKGHDLMCTCKLDDPCHANYLLKISNQ